MNYFLDVAPMFYLQVSQNSIFYRLVPQYIHMFVCFVVFVVTSVCCAPQDTRFMVPNFKVLLVAIAFTGPQPASLERWQIFRYISALCLV